MQRVGIGFDVHQLVAGDTLVLGGVNIAHSHELKGHSDADVLIHAICDALLGAAALGDIGEHFPDDDKRWANATGATLLEEVVTKLKAKNYQIFNIDSTVIAQEPKLAPYRLQMQHNIANSCGIDEAFVSVKATTTETLGFCGRKEGIAATAIVSIFIDK